ncbi:hypothetical protein B0H13DRAFT_1887137 [Mycena leptocephala]|nr:hypothetical protein B0H13DRAFT_1887137 [Mycena leptocephala]
MATIKTTTPALPDYITYRFANRLVYVRPAQTYEIALDIAQKEFVELANISRDRISFNTVATLNRQEPRVVRISESAWFVAVARQLCGGVIDILVTLDPNSPPTYLAVPAVGAMVATVRHFSAHVTHLQCLANSVIPSKHQENPKTAIAANC